MDRLGSWIDRALRRAAREDDGDRFKAVLLTGASLRKLLSGRADVARRYWSFLGFSSAPSATESKFENSEYFETLEDDRHEVYLRSAVRMIELLPTSPDEPLVDIGCGRGLLLRELEKTGFRDVEGVDVSQTAVDHAVHPRVRRIESLADIDRRYRVVSLISVLEHIRYEDLDEFLGHIRRLTDGYVAACIPTYPQNMLDFFDNDPTHIVLERREWWDGKFAEHGFEALPIPSEPLPYVMPFLYRAVGR